MLASGALTVVNFATSALHAARATFYAYHLGCTLCRFSGKSWRFGIIDFVRGYLALMVGAIVMALLLQLSGYDPLHGLQGYYQTEQKLVYCWTTLTVPSALSSLAAAFAGALLIASKKSIFTSGVMVGLALISSSAPLGVATLEGHWALALKALLRFGIDVALILFVSLAVLGVIRIWLHKHAMHL